MPRPKLERRSEGPRFTTKNGWVARVFEKDDSCSGWTPLGTTDRELAKRLLETWVRTGHAPPKARGEKSFAVEVERVMADKLASAASPDDQKAVQYRRDRLRKYALPVLGQVPVGMLEPGHIMGMLDAMAKEGAAARTIHNLRSDVSVVLSRLVRDRELKTNVARDNVTLPEEATVDTRERMHLSDEQMALFQERRGFETPLDVNVMLCRCVGGHRTSDGHAGDWSHVDRVGFATMKVRRPKTDGQVGQKVGQRKAKTKNYEYALHVVPEPYRGPLRAYWERQGRPVAGPIFPLLRDAVAKPMKLRDGRIIERTGGKVGERKGRATSYAKAFRRAVWEAKLYAPLPGFDPERPDPKFCAFQTDTQLTKRLTFHGIRASLNAALVQAGVSSDQRIAIMGHTQAATGNRHYMAEILVSVPAGALPVRIHPEADAVGAKPSFPPRSGVKPPRPASREAANPSESLARPEGFEPSTFGSVEQWCADDDAQTRVTAQPASAPTSPTEGVSTQALGGNDSRSSLLTDIAKAALAEDWDKLDRLRAALQLIDGPRPQLASVLKLSQARKRLR